MVKQVTVLFARQDSIYKTLDGVDVWDAQRDALNWPGGAPVVAHPPCREWGQLSHMAKPRADEKELGLWAVDMVRKFGGVLEHPRQSKLWPAKQLPLPNQVDEFGGWTLPIFQCNFGHTCEKPTFLYICGITPDQLPLMPITPGPQAKVIAKSRQRKSPSNPQYRMECTKPEREHTPGPLAKFLVEIARRCEARHV
ncbi:hypothetical protein [Methylomonas fluvii]|uniref:Uncharacterized protein n=1 Tax=Methylomonas fluvii TaxID=1854564 RepID=A0ABR9DIJ9_9GAMM|nr:hypothetical protein [Methylomonas fluvii]MBD9362944.1 hypothetical protein [Methylomonas fluvii]